MIQNVTDLEQKIINQGRLILILDYDGTLVPIEDRPELARPGLELIRTLMGLSQKKQIITVILSGRDLEDLKTLLPVPGIYLGGCHGAEFEYPNGERVSIVEAKELTPILEIINDKAHHIINNIPGFKVEKKKMAIALHYRLAEPKMATKILANFVETVVPLLSGYSLELLKGKKVLEVRLPSANKGKAVEHLMKIHPDCYPLYIGDDTTDEDAFLVLRDIGLGIRVAEDKIETSASARMQGPEQVLDFLKNLAMRC